MFNQDFYFQTIRKYVAVFGTLFSEINITRTDTDGNSTAYIRVPITYSQSEKMLVRVESAPDGDRDQLGLTLPVMSFEMTSIAYDGSRKLQTSGRAAYINVSDSSKLKYQYNPVPYNIGFQLNIWTKNVEDGTKIVEQILPYFTPEFTVPVNLIPELGTMQELPFTLTDVQQKNPYDTDMKKNQPIIWTLNFILKANFWGPVKTAPIILFANTNLRVVDRGETANTSNAGIIEWLSISPGQLANGQPTSNAFVTVPANTILATSDFGYILAYGHPVEVDGIIYYRSDSTHYTTDSSIIIVT